MRVGRVDGEFVVNPTASELEGSDFDLMVAGKSDAIVMVEGHMDEVSEEEMLEALDVAHEAIKKLCQGQQDLINDFGTPEPFEYETTTAPDGLVERVRDLASERLRQHLQAPYDKQTFYGGISDIKDDVVTEMLGRDEVTGRAGGPRRPKKGGRARRSARRSPTLRAR